MLLKTAGKTQSIESVLRICRVTQSLVVFILDQQLVVTLVDSRYVVL